MIALTIALLLCATTVYTLKGSLISPGNAISIASYDPQSIGMGALAVFGAAIFFGPMYGLALIFSVLVHEFGHFAAYRMAGHTDARFRLIPLIGGIEISDRAPARQDKDFFITLMGPGISLAPMVTAFILSDLLAVQSPGFAGFLWVFANTTAALNFFNLLPFWPLDGGRCMRILSKTFLQAPTRMFTIALSAGAAAAAVHLQSFLMLICILLVTQSLLHPENTDRIQTPMDKKRGVLAASAYAFTAAAHLYGGWSLITAIL